ncbi:MAG TPA: hypothetical protein VFJ15_14885 [Oleiagrimonas sp.]|nr:hypothetical protein [Oleiagrimonas sp.]
MKTEDFNVIAKRHPFDGETVFAQFQAGMTIAEALGEQAAHSASVVVGGHEIPRQLWGKIRPKTGKSVEVIMYPQGGGDGAKWIRIVAMVVITILTYGAASGYFMAGGYFAAGSASAMALAAGISIVGTLALNALVPPPMAKGLSGGGDPFDKLNSLTGTSNQASPYGVVPCVVGETRFMTAELPALQPGDEVTVNGRRYWQPVAVPGQIPRAVAIHEAGHTVASWWVGKELVRTHVTPEGAGSYTTAQRLIEGDDEAAVTAFCKSKTRKELNDLVLRELVQTMAGPMAEAREKGWGLAWQAIAEPGQRMQDEGEPPTDLQAWVTLSLLPKPKDRKRVANRSVQVAEAFLAFYWPQVEALADALQEHGELTGAEVLGVIGKPARGRHGTLTLD